MTLAWAWRRRRRDAEGQATLPSGVSVSPQRVLTQAEAKFYNLLRLTVQDRYLILSQIPVWCLVEICSDDEALRRSVLGRIALKRVDFVLVHPGTLVVEKVVELKQPGGSPKQQMRDRLVETIFKQAGMDHIRVPPQAAYTVPVLASLLGLDPPE